MISEAAPLILGSRSPRRREMLAGLSIPFVAMDLDVDESVRVGELPEVYVARVTEDKLQAFFSLQARMSHDYGAVLVADTSVTRAGKIYGKPEDATESLQMISELVGTTHEVITSYAIFAGASRSTTRRTVRTSVTMRTATLSELEGYVRSGEGADKAGAYAIQGRGAGFVLRIEGSYSSVVGLPICEVVMDLRSLGLLGGTQ